MSYGAPCTCECGRVTDDRDWREYRPASGPAVELCLPCVADIERTSYPELCWNCREQGEYAEAVTHGNNPWDGEARPLCSACAAEWRKEWNSKHVAQWPGECC